MDFVSTTKFDARVPSVSPARRLCLLFLLLQPEVGQHLRVWMEHNSKVLEVDLVRLQQQQRESLHRQRLVLYHDTHNEGFTSLWRESCLGGDPR